jgi:hypothetical protein
VQRLIRNRVTGQFLAENGIWTQDYSRAKRFTDVMAVIKTAYQIGPAQPLEQVLMVETRPSHLDLSLPLWPNSQVHALISSQAAAPSFFED